MKDTNKVDAMLKQTVEGIAREARIFNETGHHREKILPA
jgi:hypothetical protein